MTNKKFIYDGVVSGIKVTSWKVELVEMLDPETKKNKLLPDIKECKDWWTHNYNKENGAFWYKVGEE